MKGQGVCSLTVICHMLYIQCQEERFNGATLKIATVISFHFQQTKVLCVSRLKCFQRRVVACASRAACTGCICGTSNHFPQSCNYPSL